MRFEKLALSFTHIHVCFIYLTYLELVFGVSLFRRERCWHDQQNLLQHKEFKSLKSIYTTFDRQNWQNSFLLPLKCIYSIESKIRVGCNITFYIFLWLFKISFSRRDLRWQD